MKTTSETVALVLDFDTSYSMLKRPVSEEPLAAEEPVCPPGSAPLGSHYQNINQLNSGSRHVKPKCEAFLERMGAEGLPDLVIGECDNPVDVQKLLQISTCNTPHLLFCSEGSQACLCSRKENRFGNSRFDLRSRYLTR